MRILVVGASGVVGAHLVPQLRERGHEVIGTGRSPDKAATLRALGAEPVVVDVLDAAAVRQVVTAAEPDAIVYQATALTGASFSRNLDQAFAATNRLRTQGIDNLLAAARQVGVRRLVAQSYAPFRYARQGGPVKTEDDRLDADLPPRMQQTFAAMTHLDQVVTDAGGIALRYGAFYGPHPDTQTEAVRKRRYPVIGDGGGITSYIHLEDAAAATVLALEHDGPAIYNITDDEPAPMREWLPALAAALRAKPPRQFPIWLGRMFMGDALPVMTEARGASNANAKRELGWTLRYPSWRQGFTAAYGQHDQAVA